MRLDEKLWIYGGGRTAQWDWVGRKRVEAVLEALRGVEPAFRARAPRALQRRRYLAGLRYLLKRGGAARDRLACHPCMDYWLYLWDQQFGVRAAERDWHLQMGFLQGFAASLALSRGDSLELDAGPDPDGRFYLFGSPYFLELPGSPSEPQKLVISRGGLTIAGRHSPVERLPRLIEAAPGIVVDDRGWLMVHGVVMHGLATLEDAERARFAEVLKAALADMAVRDPGLHAEMTDMLRALIPLQNPMNHGSVSSSYVNMRGTICLSHSDDPLLQAETLIHEYCHQKMNQLLVVDPILMPGQSGQIFYSPWREDARRLRGLLLGAHAFLNVARYLSRSLSRESYPEAEHIESMVNVSRRILQVEEALRTLVRYGDFTEFGRRFVLGMWREAGVLNHAIQWFPPALLKEQRDACDDHRRKFALGSTGFHKSKDLVDKVARVAFLTPKSDDEVPAPSTK